MNNRQTKYHSILMCLALALTTVAVFCQVYGFGFVSYDDTVYVYENPNVQTGITLEAVKWAFSNNYANFWHPLTWLSYILDWQLYGSDPAGYHLTNLFFHIANTLLLFIVLKQMTSAFWRSAFVAALFALHPLHVESVAWVAERKDVLSTFFWMLTMWVYLGYVKHPNVRRYLLVLLTFTLGLMAKPMLVTLPFVLLLLDYWPLGRIPDKELDSAAARKVAGSSRLGIVRHLVSEKVPLFILSAVSSVVAFIAQQTGGSIASIDAVPVKLRIINALVSYATYIEKMFWPSRLAAFYPYHFSKLTVQSAAAPLLLLLAVSAVVLRLAKRHRYMVTGWLWYLGTLLPVIGLVQVGSHARADRYTYITLTGLFIIIAWGMPDLLAKLRYKQIILTTSGLLIISTLSVCTRFQLRYWKDSLTLFQRAIDVTENNYNAHSQVASSLYKQQRFDEAVTEYKKSLQIKPDDPNVLNALGVALGGQGKLDEAVECFNRALQIRPDFAAAHSNLGYALAFQGRLDEAAVHYSEALRPDPDDAATHYKLGRVLLRMGKINEAIVHFQDAVRLKPDWDEPVNTLAWYFAVSNDAEIYNPDEAVKLALRACELTNNQKPDFLDTLAVAYAAKGDFGKAVETIEKALELCQSPQQQSLKKDLENRLVLFRAGRPYVEPKQSSGPLPKRNNN